MNKPTERSVKDVRDHFAAVINAAVADGQITYITNHGRPVAAIVPIATARAAEANS